MKNTIEKRITEMLKNREKPHGLMRDLLIEMQLRELDREENKND